MAAEAAMLAPCLRDILPKVLSSGLQLCRKNRQVTDCFAPNDVANIAAEAAMLAPCLRDILPKMERHKCHAKYLRRNRHSTSTTCLMQYKCALLWCLGGAPVWHWGRPVKQAVSGENDEWRNISTSSWAHTTCARMTSRNLSSFHESTQTALL